MRGERRKISVVQRTVHNDGKEEVEEAQRTKHYIPDLGGGGGRCMDEEYLNSSRPMPSIPVQHCTV